MFQAPGVTVEHLKAPGEKSRHSHWFVLDETARLALVEAVAHLNHLHRLGRVSRSLDDAGAYRFVMHH